ncbi:hypothetical protein RJI07_04785 [Mycoplasmatota bacterium WC30]
MRKLPEKALYMNPAGKDMWMELKLDHNVIALTDIQSGYTEKVPFLTKKAAKENYFEWLENQDVRLPKSFILDSKHMTNAIYKALVNAKLPIPKQTQLKAYIFYHQSDTGYSFCTIDEDFTNTILPEIDFKYIVRVNNHKNMPDIDVKLDQVINSGLFNTKYQEEKAHA